MFRNISFSVAGNCKWRNRTHFFQYVYREGPWTADRDGIDEQTPARFMSAGCRPGPGAVLGAVDLQCCQREGAAGSRA